MLGLGGESAPLTTKVDRSAGEAVARHAASKASAQPIVDSMYARVFDGDDALANKVMAVLTEDNLRSVKGKSESPDKVHSLVGPHDGAAFKTEAEYQAALKEPTVQAAIAKWKEIVNPWMDRNYKLLKGMDEGAELESRGAQTGARINLMAMRPETEPTPGGPGGNLNAPRQNYNVFSKSATGAAEAYNTNAAEVLKNTVFRTNEKATRVDMFNKLVEAGVAQWGEKGAEPPKEIGGEKAVQIDTRIDNKDRKLYLKESLVREIRTAMDTDMAPTKSKLASALNWVQIKGPTDFVYHTGNLISGVMTAPAGKSFVANMARKIPGVNVADALTRISKAAYDIAKGSPEIKERLSKLSEIGALRSEYDGAEAPRTLLGKIFNTHGHLEKIDKAARVALDRMYDDLVERGLKKDTETDRREFINSVGQYNGRLAPEVATWLKRTGAAPFVTAGTTFNRLGRQALTGASRGESPTKAGAAQLRAEQIAGNLIAPVLAAIAINAVSGGKGKNIPLGGIDLHEKDEDGKDMYLDLLKWTLVRRGMGSTGLSALEEGVRNKRAGTTIADEAVKGVGNAALHPFIGPAPHFAYTAYTGREPALGAPSAPKAQGEKSQAWANIKYAAEKLNPTIEKAVEGYADAMRIDAKTHKGGSPVWEAAKKATVGSLGGVAGVKSAKRETSRAIDLARDFLERRQPSGEAATEEDRDSRIIRSKLTAAIREGKDPDAAIAEAVATGKVTEKQAYLSAKGAKLDPKSALFKSLDLTEAKKVLDVANPDEKELWQDLYEQKIGAKAKTLARARPLSGDREHPLKDKIAQWNAEISDAKRMLDEAGVDSQDVVRSYRKAMRGKDIGYGLANLRRQLVAAR